MSVNAVQTTAAASASKTTTGSQTSAAAQAEFQNLLTQLQSGASANASSGTATGSASSDPTEDRFLKLLVAQMRNQDPLNPADNAQITSQMAQINTVRGIESVNTQLRALVSRTGNASAADAAALVGRNVLIDGDALGWSAGHPVKAGFILKDAATAVKIEILDGSDRVIDSQDLGALPAGLQTLEWDGKTATGTAPNGVYRLRVTASNARTEVPVTPLIGAPVLAATRGAGGISLQLGALGSRSLDSVKGIL